MVHTQDVHKQFAAFFHQKELEPYLYLLSKKLSEGHICIDLKHIDREALAEGGYEQIIPPAQLKEEKLVSDGAAWEPLILFNEKLYLQRYYYYETLVLDRIITFIESENSRLEAAKKILKENKNYVQEIFPPSSVVTTDWQKIAAISAMLHSFTIITGGPGTGKTTTVARMLSLLFRLDPDLRVALAAPTGKAAARMAESLKNADYENVDTKEKIAKIEPSTLHRLLKSKRDSIDFRHDREDPLPYDLIIVDESSMIDIALFAKLLDAVGPETKVILLGDKDQLASVEAGSLFGDLCQAQPVLNQFSKERAEFFRRLMTGGAEAISAENITTSDHPLFQHVIELQQSYRFSDEEGIGRLSKAIIRNDQAVLLDFLQNKEDRVTVDAKYSPEIFEDFIDRYREFIEEPDLEKAFQKLRKWQVLCAVRKGEEGVYALNRRIERFLQSRGLIRLSGEFYEHRPVMITQNNYELGLFNGDIGLVRRNEEGELRVWFETSDGSFRSVLPASIDMAETVFAMTIHKSQGSEYGGVFIVLPRNPELPILTRELVYTAVTRAREKVILQTDGETLLAAAEKRVERGSGIIDRF